MTGQEDVVVGVAVPMGDDAVTALRETAGIAVVHSPDLLPTPRFLADHAGVSDGSRSSRLRDELAECDVLLGFPGDSAAGLRWAFDEAPRVRWVHGTAAGAGEKARSAGLDAADLERTALTTSAGVHAVPLAEFAVFGLLAFLKDLDRLLDVRADRSWPTRWPMAPLSGRTVAVLGLGSVGRAVATRLQPFGARVIGVRRRPGGSPPDGVASVHGFADLGDVVSGADDLVVTLPGTPETEGVVDAGLLSRLGPGSVVVNVGRGSVVDEFALADALRGGRLRAAVLDVAAVEPRDPGHPLWGLTSVLQSPHTAALAVAEDSRIVELFLANLERFRSGAPLLNRVRAPEYY